MGMNGMTIEQELEMDIKKLNSFQTLNETREKWDLPAIKETGDIIENSVYWQAESAKQQREQQEQQQQMQGGYGEEGGGQGWGDYDEEGGDEENYNPFDEYAEGDEDEGEEDEEPEDEADEDTEKSETNAFVKAFEDFLAKEEKSGTVCFDEIRDLGQEKVKGAKYLG